MLVYLAPWEFDCCGEPFAIGDEVTWSIAPVVEREPLAVTLGTELAREVDGFETHHDDETDRTRPVSGIVSRIRVALVELASTPADPVSFRPVLDTLELRELEHLDQALADAIRAEFEPTLLEGGPLPPAEPIPLPPIGDVRRIGGEGWLAVVPGAARMPRRHRGIHGYLVDLDGVAQASG